MHFIELYYLLYLIPIYVHMFIYLFRSIHKHIQDDDNFKYIITTRSIAISHITFLRYDRSFVISTCLHIYHSVYNIVQSLFKLHNGQCFALCTTESINSSNQYFPLLISLTTIEYSKIVSSSELGL